LAFSTRIRSIVIYRLNANLLFEEKKKKQQQQQQQKQKQVLIFE
jgi:hypothetical protein